jgi:hypothetical protein
MVKNTLNNKITLPGPGIHVYKSPRLKILQSKAIKLKGGINRKTIKVLKGNMAYVNHTFLQLNRYTANNERRIL